MGEDFQSSKSRISRKCPKYDQMILERVLESRAYKLSKLANRTTLISQSLALRGIYWDCKSKGAGQGLCGRIRERRKLGRVA